MKTKTIILFSTLLTQTALYGQVLLYDDFNGTSINSSLWQVLTPMPDSQMYESGGDAVFFQRGTLVTQQSLPNAYEISGSFAFTGDSYDIFSVMLRTDGALDPSYGQFTDGVLVEMALSGSDYPYEPGQQNIYLTCGPGETTILGITSFLFQEDNFYNFKIVDDGYNVQLFIQDMTTPLLSGSTAYAAGDNIGLQNRGYVPWWPTYDNQVNLDYISISVVPEPSSLAMIALGIAGLIGIKKAK